MKVSSQEVFGPLIGVQGYDSLDEALALANDSRYGLQAAIFTQDLKTALKAAHSLDFGGVTVNEMPTFRTDQMPYGGVKDSGNTKEGPHYSVARDDRGAPGGHPALSRPLDGRGGRNSLRATSTSGDRMGQLDGKVALVTGAASGIGRATAARLASEGARICCVDIDPRAPRGRRGGRRDLRLRRRGRVERRRPRVRRVRARARWSRHRVPERGHRDRSGRPEPAHRRRLHADHAGQRRRRRLRDPCRDPGDEGAGAAERSWPRARSWASSRSRPTRCTTSRSTRSSGSSAASAPTLAPPASPRTPSTRA